MSSITKATITIEEIERLSQIKYTQPDHSEVSKADELANNFSSDLSFIEISLSVLKQSLNSYALMLCSSSILNILTDQKKDLDPASVYSLRDQIIELIFTKSYPTFILNMLLAIPARITRLFYLRSTDPSSTWVTELLTDIENTYTNLIKSIQTNSDKSPFIHKILLELKFIQELVGEMGSPCRGLSPQQNKKGGAVFKENDLFRILVISFKILSLLNSSYNNMDIPGELFEENLKLLCSVLSFDYSCSSSKEKLEYSLHFPLFFQSILMNPMESSKTEGFDIICELCFSLQRATALGSFENIKTIITCLCYLSSVRRSIFPDEKIRLSYLSKLFLAAGVVLRVTKDLITSAPEEGQELVFKSFELLYTIKATYPASELLAIPIFWKFFDLTISFSAIALENVPFSDQRFRDLFRYWSKIANSVHFLYTGEKPDSIVITKFIESANNPSMPCPPDHVHFLLLENVRNPNFQYTENFAETISFYDSSSLRDSISNTLSQVSRKIVESLVISAERDPESAFPDTGSPNLSSYFPSIARPHGAPEMLLAIVQIFDQSSNAFADSIERNSNFQQEERKLAKLIEVMDCLTRSNSFFIDGSDSESIGKDGFASIAYVLIKTVVLAEMRLNKYGDLSSLKHLDLAFLKLTKTFSISFFDSNSPLNYYNKLTLDTAFFENAFNKLGKMRDYFLDTEMAINIKSNELVRLDKLDINILEGVLVRRCFSILKLYEEKNILEASIKTLVTLLTADLDLEKLTYFKVPESGVISGRSKYVHMLLTGNFGPLFKVAGGLESFRFSSSSDKDLLKTNKLVFALSGTLIRSKQGMKYFSSLVAPLENLFEKIDSSTGSMGQNEKNLLLGVCYSITGLSEALFDYSSLAILISWFTERWNTVILRIFESWASDGEVSAAIIKLYCSLINADGIPSSVAGVGCYGGEMSSDELILILFRDSGRLISLLANKLSDSSTRTSTQSDSTAIFKPLALILRLLDSILGCSTNLFGAMKYYGDNGVKKYVDAAMRAVLSYPFLDVVAHEKLFYYLVKMNKSLVKNHISILAELGNNVIGPVLGITLEALQMPDKGLRANAADTLFFLMEYRYKCFLKPTWKKSESAKLLDGCLKMNTEIIINCFEAMIDNYMVGNWEKYSDFDLAIFLIILNYEVIFTNYENKILSYQKNDEIREKLAKGFKNFKEEVNWEYIDDDNLDDFRINISDFGEEISQLPVRVTHSNN